jgi:hypothetical protein
MDITLESGHGDATPQDAAPNPIQHDPRNFAVALWNPPPPPSDENAEDAPPDPAPQRRPLPTLQLLAIIHEGDDRQAAIYLPQQDEVVFLRVGDTLEQHEISAISHESVTFGEGHQAQSFLLVRSDQDDWP